MQMKITLTEEIGVTCLFCSVHRQCYDAIEMLSEEQERYGVCGQIRCAFNAMYSPKSCMDEVKDADPSPINMMRRCCDPSLSPTQRRTRIVSCFYAVLCSPHK